MAVAGLVGYLGYVLLAPLAESTLQAALPQALGEATVTWMARAALFLPGAIAGWFLSPLVNHLLNLFFGWTCFGWLGALIWAATAPRRPIEYRIVHDERVRCGRYC